jgi:hypothetical protein
MAGNLTPAQSFTHNLVMVAGKALMHELQISVAKKTGETWEKGALCQLDDTLGTNGKPVALEGCSDYAQPLFAINGSEEFGANSDVGNFAGGFCNFVPGNSGMELFTTEYVAGTYNPNTFLRPGLSTELGLVKASATNYNDNAIVGQVSRGKVVDGNGITVLYFWAKAIPAHKAT